MLRKLLVYLKRHYDFLIVDVMAFFIAYFVSVKFRRAMDIPIHHGDMFLTFGIICGLIFLLSDIFSHNLNGIVQRSIAKEAESTFSLMLFTWSIYTVVLYTYKVAYNFSRAVYFTTFFVCFFTIFLFRSFWKFIVKTGYKNISPPKVIIVCDSESVNHAIKRLLPSSYEGMFDIDTIITNKEAPNYYDWFKHEVGLNKIEKIVKKRKIQEAYVDLNNAEEEKTAIQALLKSEVIVHKSLGDGEFHYASQHIGTLGYTSVLTIEGLNASLASRADKAIVKILFEKSKENVN